MKFITSYSSKHHPCPLCGREKDSDCRMTDKGLVLCHTYRDSLPGEVIEGKDGQRWAYSRLSDNKVWGVWTVHKARKNQQIPQKRPRPASRKEFVYQDGDGQPVVMVVRQDDGQGKKRIYQLSWNGSGWVKGGVDQVADRIRLYRIAEARQMAQETGHPIFLVEGEACADALLKLGIPATTSIGGAGKWHKYGHPNYIEDLQGHRVVLCPDCDQPGVAHMRDIEKSLREHGIEILGWLLAPPDAPWDSLPHKGGLDVGDWLEQGATIEQLLKAVQPDPPMGEDEEDLAAEVNELASLGQGAHLALLPEELETPLRHLARRMNLPIEAYYWALLCVAASQVESQTRLELDRQMDYRVPPILWGGIVGETGSRKTPILNAITGPLATIQAELEHHYQQKLEEYQTELSEYEGSKKSNKQARPPEAPKPVDLYLNDFTLEALAVAVANHPERGLLVNQDELANFFKSMDAYRKGRGSDRARWLEFYNGRALKVDRKTTGRIFAPRTSISIIGGIQPSVIGSLWEEDKTGEDGLWARFGWVRIQITTSDGIRSGTTYDLGPRLGTLYRQLQALPAGTFRLDQQGIRLWNRWHHEIDQQILQEPSDILRATLPKTKDRAARIALVLHLIEAAWQRNLDPPEVIPATTLAKAIDFTRWLQGQTRLLYGELGVVDNPEASRILKFVNRFRGCGPITLLQVRNWWSGRKKPTKDEIQAFLKQVEQTGRLRWIDSKTVEVIDLSQSSQKSPESHSRQSFQGRLRGSQNAGQGSQNAAQGSPRGGGGSLEHNDCTMTKSDYTVVNPKTLTPQGFEGRFDQVTTKNEEVNKTADEWERIDHISPPPRQVNDPPRLGVALHEKLREIAGELGETDLGIPSSEPAYTLDLGWVFAIADRLRAKAQGKEPPEPNLDSRQIVFSYATAKGKKKVVVKPDGSLQIFGAVQ